MSLPPSFQTVEEINYRYTGSIIYKGKKPILVRDALHQRGDGHFVNGANLYYLEIGEGFNLNQKDTPASDPELSDGPFSLGYINGIEHQDDEGHISADISYCTRVPVRKWKQGLTQQNLSFQGGGLTFNKACVTKGFMHMLQGVYPSFEEAKKNIGPRIRRIAYNRHWAIGVNKIGTYDLFYRGQGVGVGAKSPDQLELGPKFTYLQEAFNDGK